MGIVSLPVIGPDPTSITSDVLNGKVDPLATEFNGNTQNVNIASDAAIVASKLNLATIAQVMAMSSKEFLFAKGADVASGTSITLGTDGNVFDITGTTTIQTIATKQAGAIVILHFDGALTLTDNTGNLELQGSDLAVLAETEVILKSDGTNWHFVASSLRNASSILTTQGDTLFRDGSGLARLAIGTANQIYHTNSGATAPEWKSAQIILQSLYDSSTTADDTTTVIPFDNTLPTSSEGAATDLSIAITAANASNFIEVSVSVYASSESGSILPVATLLDGSTVVAVGTGFNAASGPIPIFFRVAAGDTNEHTWTVRFGPGSAGTCGYNTNASAVSVFGTATLSTLFVKEIQA